MHIINLELVEEVHNLEEYLIESAEAVRDDSNADGSAINPNNVVFNQCFWELQDGIVKMSGRNV